MPLSTLGDAAVSFLTERDTCTKGMSLADRVSIDHVWKNKKPKMWMPKKQRWYAVSSLWTWIGTIFAYASYWHSPT